LRNLSQHLEFVREKESKRIAGEIHDVLGQQLTSLKIDLSWLTERVQAGEEDAGKILEKISAMSGLIDQTIQAVQKISAELRPGMLDDLGLLPAIEWLAMDFQNRTKIKCRTRFDRDEIALDPDLATAIFRISQEALTNVVRHANATRVNISLKAEDGGLVLTIKDNGNGIKEERVWDATSLGIMGMRERARRFRGELLISGTPQRGTTLTAVFPKAMD
jgi:two-component system sensor histidine kinase UhpB